MKTITKFIFGFLMLALACGSIASAQIPLEPLIPPDSARKRDAHPMNGLGGGDHVTETVDFKSKDGTILSRWHLTVYAVRQFGLVIRDASFQKSADSPFTYVLFDGRLAEIFVPYHKGGKRYRDISYYGSRGDEDDFIPMPLDPEKFSQAAPGVKPEDAALKREIIGSDKLICKEVRRYLAWMTPNGKVRYGQEVVYFSVLKAANYAYIMEWTFRDDGTIVARAGSTGPKNDADPADPDADTEGHMHNFTWRLDIDLNGADANSAYWTSHEEDLTLPKSTAEDKKVLIEMEQSKVWDPAQFNTLEVGDARLQNGNSHDTSYELVPMRTGTARHSEPWTKADFWVTQYNPSQILAVTTDQSKSLADYVLDGKSTINKDLVIWYTGSEHHENNSRDEDRSTVPVLWTGFELVPHNLFDDTPFYPSEQ